MRDPLEERSPEELFDQGRWLRRVALAVVADEATADDLAQEAWLRLARREGGVVRDPRAFLAGVVRKLAWKRSVSEHRRRRREAEHAEARREASDPGHERVLEAQAELVAAVRALPDAQRRAVMLRYYEGRSAAEIARLEGCPPGTVRARLKRALDALRARLDGSLGPRASWAAALLRLPGEGTPPVPVGAPHAPPTSGWLTLGGLMGTHALLKLTSVAVVAGLAATWILRSSDDGPVPIDAGLAPAPEGGEVALSAGGARDGGARAAVAPEVERSATPAEPAAALAPVELLVVDRASGAPVPDFRVDVARGGAPEDPDGVTTDASGRAWLAAALFEAPFEFVPADHPALGLRPLPRRIEPADRPSPGEPLELVVDVGPTYRLEFDPAVGPSLPSDPPLGARLAARPRREVEFGEPLGAPLRAPLAAGGLPWVRFAPGDTAVEAIGHEPPHLIVRDLAGSWFASGPVRTTAGLQPEPVRMTGGPTGSLFVQVTVEGAAPRTSLWLELEPPGAREGSARTAPLGPLSGRPDGGAALAFLEPARYTARVSGPGLVPFEAELDVTPRRERSAAARPRARRGPRLP